jgi:UDP-2,3-diacylglucosamine hydrolase
MGMKFFLSDFHFGANTETDGLIFSQFENFCNLLSTEDELYILGDFFDFWIEYETVVQADFIELYSILQNTVKRGIKVFMVRGNHDFIRGKFWKKLGIEVFDKSIIFELNGKKFYCTHGDEVKGKRSITKLVLRNGFFQFLYKLLHPDFAIWLAGSLSELSRKKDLIAVKSEEKRKKKWRKRAFRFIDEKNCDVLIMGHSHIFDLAVSDGKIYANSGFWFDRPTFIAIEKNKIFLKEFCKNVEKDIILSEMEF